MLQSLRAFENNLRKMRLQPNSASQNLLNKFFKFKTMIERYHIRSLEVNKINLTTKGNAVQLGLQKIKTTN